LGVEKLSSIVLPVREVTSDDWKEVVDFIASFSISSVGFELQVRKDSTDKLIAYFYVHWSDRF